MFLGYACRRCRAELRPDEATYRCPHCSGNLDVRCDFGKVSREALAQSRDPSLWRYAALLPVPVRGGDPQAG